MMYYMMANLAANSPMNQEALQIILSLSVHVIEIFALIFLFYTNSFLIKEGKEKSECITFSEWGNRSLRKCW